MIRLLPLQAEDAPAVTNYAQAMSVDGASRLLFVSGQIPEDADGRVPDSFDAQARLAWANVKAQLRAGGMGFDDLVKVTVFLGDRANRDASSRIRSDVLGDRKVGLTCIITGIYDEAWMIEIEAVAAK